MSLWPDVLDALNGVTRQRVAWLTFGGTWSVPGTGYCSWVLGAADEGLVYELPVDGPYTFGPIPPTSSATAPSYRQSVAIARANAILTINTLPAGTRYGIAGYSMGAEAAADVADELLPGGELAGRAHDFVGGFTIGNPRRISGAGLGPGLTPVPGHGISGRPMLALPAGWVDYVNVDGGMPDRYAASPDGPVGAIMADGYDFGIDLQLGDLVALIKAEVSHAFTILQAAGVGLDDLTPMGILGLGESAFIGLLETLVPQLSGLLNVAALKPKTAAAAQAAILGLEFAASGVRPHVTYDVDYITPGVTFLQHAVGHVNQTSATALAA